VRSLVLLLAAGLLAAGLLAAVPAHAVPPPQRLCGTTTAAGASASVVVQTWGVATCPLPRRVVGTWLKTHRARIGPWRCARLPHLRGEENDQVAACDLTRVTIRIERRRASCGLLYRGPRAAVRVQTWGVAHTRCGTAQRLVRAFLDHPLAHRAGWTCHVPGPAAFTDKDYRVDCRRGLDAGVYGFDAD
jgi:hypothetical protein